MFRDPLMWRNLRNTILPKYRYGNIVNIWHAGCSTGEEVYSMGILLRESGFQNKAIAYCTDINQHAINEAKAGIYHKIKMIENENNYRQYNPLGNFQQYLYSEGTSVKMNGGIIEHCKFAYHNLVTDGYPSGVDMIFCRNVMIYFDNPAKLKILTRFHESLNPGGYLIIGFFDTMSHLMDNDKFELVNEEAKIFQKRESFKNTVNAAA